MNISKLFPNGASFGLSGRPFPHVQPRQTTPVQVAQVETAHVARKVVPVPPSPNFSPAPEFVSGCVRPDGTTLSEIQVAYDSRLAVRVLQGRMSLMMRLDCGSYKPLRDYCSLAASWETYLCRIVLFEARAEDDNHDGFYFPASLETVRFLGHHFPPYLLVLWGRGDIATHRSLLEATS